MTNAAKQAAHRRRTKAKLAKLQELEEAVLIPAAPERYRAELEREGSLHAVRLDREAHRLRGAAKRKRGEERDALIARANDAAAMAAWWWLVAKAAKGEAAEAARPVAPAQAA